MNKNIVTGIGWGVVSTITMSLVHFLARTLGVFPASKPAFIAIPSRVFGSGLSGPLLVALGIGCHLAYGGFWGGVFSAVTRRVTIWKGIGMGVFLWLILQLVVFPWLGSGIFGSHVSWKLAPASLLTHLTYGTTLGWLGARSTSPSTATAGNQPL